MKITIRYVPAPITKDTPVRNLTVRFPEEYKTWIRMKQRCSTKNKGLKRYTHYGIRGITVCGRWIGDPVAGYVLTKDGFRNFLLDMGLKPSPKHSLERIDNNGNYEPGNCRWATKTEQNRNTRKTLYLTLYGVTKSSGEWSEIIGIPTQYIRARKVRGWSDEEVLTKPFTIPNCLRKK